MTHTLISSDLNRPLSARIFKASRLVWFSFFLFSVSNVSLGYVELEKDEWDLSEIYVDVNAWEEERSEFESTLADLQSCSTQRMRNARVMANCLNKISQSYKTLNKLYSYAQLGSDRGGSEPSVRKFTDLLSIAASLHGRFNQAISELDSNIIDVGTRKLKRYLSSSKALEPHSFYITNLIRRSEDGRILSAPEERIVAIHTEPLNQFYSVYSDFFTKDLLWPSIISADGEDVLLNTQGYAKARTWKDREKRELAFINFYGKMNDYKSTLGGLLAGALKANIAQAKTRNFDSALRSRLADDNLPIHIYTALINATRTKIGTLHRYFKFRQRMLGLSQLAYYDIYPPLVEDIEKTFTIEEGKQIMLKALQPLGANYINFLRRGLAGNWMDVYPRKGKSPGAYMNGSVYDTHPFILMNYQETFQDVSTLVHEWGHAIHTELAKANQPYEKTQYPTFIAEIASIVPETLLIDHMILNAKSPEEKLFYLVEAMEQIRGTYYRQVMFSEFERDAYASIEEGQPATGNKFAEIYSDLVRFYHGADRNIVEVPQYIEMEWAFVPHFYYNFYTFQYATSLAASLYLVKNIVSEQGGREDFLDLMKAGGSDYPHDLLTSISVDLRDPEVYLAVSERLDQLLDQAELVLAEIEGRQTSPLFR